VTRYPAFIARAAEAKLRDALDHANDQVRRLEAENVRLTQENVTLRRKLDEVTKSHDVAVEGWIRVAGERDELAKVIDDRDPECVAKWPECESCLYDPRCCRFPKSCSAGRRW
jgi:regulator of replication initiation timing